MTHLIEKLYVFVLWIHDFVSGGVIIIFFFGGGAKLKLCQNWALGLQASPPFSKLKKFSRFSNFISQVRANNKKTLYYLNIYILFFTDILVFENFCSFSSNLVELLEYVCMHLSQSFSNEFEIKYIFI